MPKKSPNTNRTASLTYEYQYWESGCHRIVGLDEAGRGTWAGPVSAGAVCLPLERGDLSKVLAGVRDSKQMTPRQRGILVERIKEVATTWGVGSASSEEIDEFGIVPATKLAMKRALEMTRVQPDCLFLDSLAWPEVNLPQISLVKGDSRSLSIAAASVVAKVWRDEYMRELDKQYPQYGFAVHKGYGTARHHAALKQYGPCAIHRMTFAPLRALNAAQGSNKKD